LTSSLPRVLHGARRPQARNVPARITSAGTDAIQITRQAGLILDDWQCDVLDGALGERADGKWSAFEVGLIVSRQQGKGTLLEARVLAGMLLFGERLILWSAHEVKTATESFLRCVALFEADPELRKQVKHIHRANGEQGIELRNGSRLRFVARSKGSGRGFSADLIILDEAYALTAEQMAALLPVLASRPNPQVWYTSSPPLDGASGEPLYALRKRAKAGDPGLAWFDWGLPGVDLESLDGLDLDDRDLWAATNPALGIRISEEHIARERAALSREAFARERIGIWPRKVEAGSGVIADELWEQQIDGAGVRPGEVVFAVQVNSRRTQTAIAAVGRRPDGTMLASIVDYRAGTYWVAERMAELQARHCPLLFVAQDKGPTGPLFLEFAAKGITVSERQAEPRRGELVVPWSNDVADAYGLFVDAVHQHRLFHLDEAPLNVALANSATRALSGGTAWDYADPDAAPLLAVTLATWAYLTHFDSVSSAYDPLANIF
jgi:hypothetical protein